MLATSLKNARTGASTKVRRALRKLGPSKHHAVVEATGLTRRQVSRALAWLRLAKVATCEGHGLGGIWSLVTTGEVANG